MKKWMMGMIAAASLTALAGTVELPTDRIAFPEVGEGSYLVCIWDEAAKGWYQDFSEYDHSGSYTLLPGTREWNRWYWVGLWDMSAGRYVYGTWIGHVKTN